MLNPWLISSLMLFLAWLVIFIYFKKTRKEMLWASIITTPLGLTEPLFVPEYWNPPSLFNLAAKTGFDIESFIFAFAIGGIASVMYELIFKTKHKKISLKEMHSKRHRLHKLALISPIIVFIPLFYFLKINIIYITIISLLFGGIATILCRMDLKKKIIFDGFSFLIFYFIFFFLINLIFPSWVEQIWNLNAISGILFLGIPIEELLFAFSVGLMWGSIYEHVKWYRLKQK